MTHKEVSSPLQGGESWRKPNLAMPFLSPSPSVAPCCLQDDALPMAYSPSLSPFSAFVAFGSSLSQGLCTCYDFCLESYSLVSHFIHVSAQMCSPTEALSIQISSPHFSLSPHLLYLSSTTAQRYHMSLSFTVCLWEEIVGSRRMGVLLTAAFQDLKQCLAMVGAQYGLVN